METAKEYITRSLAEKYPVLVGLEESKAYAAFVLLLGTDQVFAELFEWIEDYANDYNDEHQPYPNDY